VYRGGEREGVVRGEFPWNSCLSVLFCSVLRAAFFFPSAQPARHALLCPLLFHPSPSLCQSRVRLFASKRKRKKVPAKKRTSCVLLGTPARSTFRSQLILRHIGQARGGTQGVWVSVSWLILGRPCAPFVSVGTSVPASSLWALGDPGSTACVAHPRVPASSVSGCVFGVPLPARAPLLPLRSLTFLREDTHRACCASRQQRASLLGGRGRPLLRRPRLCTGSS
jgi:hypothetical protein